jgi:hypothetical protein
MTEFQAGSFEELRTIEGWFPLKSVVTPSQATNEAAVQVVLRFGLASHRVDNPQISSIPVSETPYHPSTQASMDSLPPTVASDAPDEHLLFDKGVPVVSPPNGEQAQVVGILYLDF